tara:strand:- start:119 stop:709 length:591 start_codon:yes stop_codon:yes gene_type:complete
LEAVIFLFAIIVVYFLITSSGRKPRYRKGRSYRSRQRKSNNAKTSPYTKSKVAPLSIGTILNGPAYVIDGDSLIIRKTKIRLFGIDAPEFNHPYGKKAKWALFTLCKGQSVRAEITSQDVHGRTVAKCYLTDGRDLSAEMVKQGLAIDWPKFSKGKYKDLEVIEIRKKLWLADARQKGRMDVWDKFNTQNTPPKKL